MKIIKYIKSLTGMMLPLLLPFTSCSEQDIPSGDAPSVPEGMVEIRPALPDMFTSIPRDASGSRSVESRAYDSDDDTDGKLEKKVPLPEGSTVWLIVKSRQEEETEAKYIKKSYVVHNSGEENNRSYLMPCTVDDEGKVKSMEGTPLYLKNGQKYLFYAVSPARKLDEEQFKTGKVSFKVHNGEYFYANDCRYPKATPKEVEVKAEDNSGTVYQVELSPVMNQSAELKFQIQKGDGVHDLDIQPSGIEVSGLQNDSPNGIEWHMSQAKDDEPIILKHGDKSGTYRQYNYKIDSGNIHIEVPVLPMYSISKPVIVVFRLKVNGVPTSYEMMLNEKDFKAGYSYGYRGKVSIQEGVEVITWQYVSWDYEVDHFNKPE